MRDPEELCRTECELKGQCYICRTMLCAHKVIEHLDKGHIIWPLPYHVSFNPMFDKEDRVIECNQAIMHKFDEIAAQKIIELQQLEEEVDESVYVTKEPFTIDQVKNRVEALGPINDLLSKLEDQLGALAEEFIKPVVVSAADNIDIMVWDDGQLRFLRGTNTEEITSVCLSENNGLIIAGGFDGRIRVWDLDTKELIQELEGELFDLVESVAICSKGQLVVSGHRNNLIKVWSLAAGKKTMSIQAHSSYVTSVAISAKDEYVVSGNMDKTIVVSSLNTGELIRILEGHCGNVNSVAISKNDLYIVSGSNDNTVRVWNLASGDQVRVLEGHYYRVESVAISSNGSFVVSAGRDQTIRIWSVTSGEITQTLETNASSVNLSSEDKYLVSGDEDGDFSVRVWELSTGQQIQELEGHTNPVLSVAISSCQFMPLKTPLKNDSDLSSSETGYSLETLLF